ncbi:hypothetical protein ACOMHN_050802 [Nucella lapillus]
MSCKIRNWRVCYYHNDQHRWIYGLLTCSPYNIKFHAENATGEPPGSRDNPGDHHQNDEKSVTVSENESDDLLLQYTDIKQVQKARSMFMFSAVTVETQGGTVHWFSSLPDRHSVFNALEYFSRHTLLDTNKAKKPTCHSATRTLIGQKLLQSAEDSECTLAAAAAELHAQGRQLDRASVRLTEMHEDLDSADRLLSGLDTYLGQWSLPPQYKQVEMVQISKDHDLEVLSSELSKDQWRCQLLTFLRVTESGLTLLTSRQRLLHSFRWMDLSRVFVVSLWEVVLTKHVAGRADVSVSVVSSALLPVLRLLDRKVSHLMDYQTPPPASLQDEGVSLRETSRTTNASQEHDRSVVRGSHRLGAGRLGSPLESKDPSPQLQTGKQTQEQVSEEEASALCSKLGSLKSMARAVGDELVAQNESLEDMIASVDHADTRVRDATRRTKKLM